MYIYIYIYIFVVLRLELRAYTLSHSNSLLPLFFSPFCDVCIFEIGFHKLRVASNRDPPDLCLPSH
jgi:hypothetical protein